MFLATALMIPSVITLTYKKANEGIPEITAEETYTETEARTETEPEAKEETTAFDWFNITEPETTAETEPAVKVYTDKQSDEVAVDKFTYYPNFEAEWKEEEERVLGPMTTEPETEPEPETEEETTAPETTKAPETTVPAPKPAEPDKEPDKTPSTAPKNNTGEYVGCDAKYIKVYIRSSGKYVDMLMGDYLIGVIAAEMPVRFGIEALKAQAVASRTFAVYKSMSDTYYHSAAHGSEGADVCTNSGHCQAYLSYESALSSWSDREYVKTVYDKIKRAVIETSGVVATYKGKPIEAVFHASSYGSTDSMANIWGGGESCLIGVSTPETLDTPYVYSTEVFTSAEVREIITDWSSKAELSSDPSEWMKISLNENGRVKTLQIGNVSITGQTSKSLFGLSSNNFRVSYNKDTDKFTFEVYGWGHGVGMSQYGAGIYAEQGRSYEYIIKHYYSNTELTVWG